LFAAMREGGRIGFERVDWFNGGLFDDDSALPLTRDDPYNERPAWLDNAHRDLDAAVAAAYGWPADIGEEDALVRLLALNLERAGRQ
jgi:hypothetical protein